VSVWQGLHGQERAVVLSSELAHYSVEKASAILGLGEKGAMTLPVDSHQRLDTTALADAITKCARRRWKVIAVVGIAGSTDSGSIDALDRIADLTEPAGIHFHVDAAWGGSLLFSEAHR